MLLLMSDIDITARTVWGEARGADYEHQKLIAHVLKNRWTRTDGQFARDDSLATACLRHLQFSAWNATDPNFMKLYSADIDDASFRQCFRATLEAIDELHDPTFGATHYHTLARPGWAKVWPPDWAQGRLPCLVDGPHAFYNDVP